MMNRKDFVSSRIFPPAILLSGSTRRHSIRVYSFNFPSSSRIVLNLPGMISAPSLLCCASRTLHRFYRMTEPSAEHTQCDTISRSCDAIIQRFVCGKQARECPTRAREREQSTRGGISREKLSFIIHWHNQEPSKRALRQRGRRNAKKSS